MKSEDSERGTPRTRRRLRWLLVIVPLGLFAVVIILVNNADSGVGAPEVPGLSNSTASEVVPDQRAGMSSPSAPEPNLESPVPATSEPVESDDAETAPEVPTELTEEKEPTKPLPKPVKIKIDQVAQLTETVTAQIGSIERVRATGRGPGELSGAALRVTFDLTNNGANPLDLSTTIVTLETLDGEPASPVASDPSAKLLAGTLAPGKSATGAYLFLAPKGLDRKIQIDFSTSTEEPVLVFRGHLKDVGSK